MYRYFSILLNFIVSARKLTTTECPLLLLLNWVRISTNREKFLELLKQKRIVLQENDACDIEVSGLFYYSIQAFF